MPKNRSIPDVKRRRKCWSADIAGYPAENLVFLDETTAERFRDYLENVLLPTLDDHAVIIMDNMRSHHAKTVKALLDERKIAYLYLPPYSPDLNPIEKL